MATKLSTADKRKLENDGALLAPLPSLQAQPKATYWNRYGERFDKLPADLWSMQSFRKRGFTLSPPEHPEPKPDTDLVGISDWDGETVYDEAGRPTRPVTSAGPMTTYYTAGGTPVEGLADPASMKEYLALGLTLDPPAEE